jgi:hypothetical protein
MPHHLLTELVRLHNCEMRRDASRRALVRALRRRGAPSL